MAVSCVGDAWLDSDFEHSVNDVSTETPRRSEEESRNVLLMYAAGYNSLASYLKNDIADFEKGYLPGEGRNQDVLLVYSHLTAANYDYRTPSSPVLFRIYKDVENNIIKDTLVVYPEDTRSSTAAQLHEVLSYVKDNFSAKTYGMVFSSHSTGYLPAGYYGSPTDSDFDIMSYRRQGWRKAAPRPVPYREVVHDPSMPAVKSIGQDDAVTETGRMSYEIELPDFADAIPMYLDYLLFDTCLMGGIEVAYELKDKCRSIGFSQAEVMAEGFDYTRLTSHLLKPTPDPQSVCEDFYNQYIAQTGQYQSATISYVDCTALEPLADVCADLFEKYRQEMDDISPSSVQRYFRGNCHWFYDLKSIIRNAGVEGAELQNLQDALDECVVYKAATPYFMNTFPINEHSGFSMYLPCNGGPNLDRYYKGLAWNIRTGLVE